jgi:thiamine biosynthesis lipoprotein
MVMGPGQGEAFAEEAGIAALFITRSSDGFVSHASAEFTRRFGEGATQ